MEMLPPSQSPKPKQCKKTIINIGFEATDNKSCKGFKGEAKQQI